MTDPIVIIGGGPHGLAAAAHLRGAGLEVRCFGEPLEFWRRQMPAGMMLRSRKRSSNISDPARALTIEDFERNQNRRVHMPNLMLDEFIDYGLWFQNRVVPDLDQRKVARLSADSGRFQLTLTDGEELSARRVVVAAGLAPFPARPGVFASLPPTLVSHSSEHADLGTFAGRRVAVIGAGQSALESAVLLGERGAQVEVLIREPEIRWLADGDGEPPRRLPPTDVGGMLNGWIAAAPDAFRLVPRSLQPTVSYRCIRPAGSGWLRPRLGGVTLSCGRTVVRADPEDDGLRLTLDDGSQPTVDHVLLGTGFAVDVTRYEFLAPELIRQLRTQDGYPVLEPGLESSVPGLHFLGAPAALSFGPIMRFVVGTWYDAPAVTERIVGRPPRRLRFSF